MQAIVRDYRQAALSAPDRAMLDFSVKLTRHPGKMSATDVELLRRHGFDDATIHDIAQVAALFNYYDRLADGLGVEPEPEWS